MTVIRHSLHARYSVMIYIRSFLYNPQIFEIGSISINFQVTKMKIRDVKLIFHVFTINIVPYSTEKDGTWNAFRGSGKACLYNLLLLSLKLTLPMLGERSFNFWLEVCLVPWVKEKRHDIKRKCGRYSYELFGTYWIHLMTLVKKSFSLAWTLGISWRLTLHTRRVLLRLPLILILEIEVWQIWS